MFENRNLVFWIVINTILTSLLGLMDYLTGNELNFFLFYLIPISITTWYANQSTAFLASCLSVAVWLCTDYLSGYDYFHPIIYFWNTIIRLGFFYIVIYLLSELHKSQKAIQALADTDYVTGAINYRYFHRLAETELDRLRRYNRPFTLVYIDLDNFKLVNDRFGHDEGDKLLRLIATELKSQLRIGDIVARLGGDEFGVLFPEAGQHEAEAIISKLYGNFIAELKKKYPFVTLSAGAVTFTVAPDSINEALKIADQLMYSVKNSTKNRIQCVMYAPD